MSREQIQPEADRMWTVIRRPVALLGIVAMVATGNNAEISEAVTYEGPSTTIEIDYDQPTVLPVDSNLTVIERNEVQIEELMDTDDALNIMAMAAMTG